MGNDVKGLGEPAYGEEPRFEENAGTSRPALPGELGSDGKEWAKTQAGFAHVDAVKPRADAYFGISPLWHGWAIREAFVAGAEWQEARTSAALPGEGETETRKALDAAREQQIDRVARYLRETMQAGKNLTHWEVTNKSTKKKWIALATGALKSAALASEDVQGWRTDMTTVPKDGSPLMIWVVDGIMQPHCFAPISITENGAWWDDATGDQIAPIKGATAWQPAPPAPETQP